MKDKKQCIDWSIFFRRHTVDLERLIEAQEKEKARRRKYKGLCKWGLSFISSLLLVWLYNGNVPLPVEIIVTLTGMVLCAKYVTVQNIHKVWHLFSNQLMRKKIIYCAKCEDNRE